MNEAIKAAAVRAIDEEIIDPDYTGTIKIELVCNSGGVRDVWVDKRRRLQEKK
jgi:dUTPase